MFCEIGPELAEERGIGHGGWATLTTARGQIELPEAVEMARRIAALERRARAAGVPCIYVNDNFGRWKSDFRAQVSHCMDDGVRGRALVEQVLPSEHDYFVLKPMHSGFFGTSLELLLRHLEARTLVLTGIAANNCVLFTANDAYMRGYRLIVPADAVVSNSRAETEAALVQLRTVVKATTPPAQEVDFAALARQAGSGSSPTSSTRRPSGPRR
jgi:nicotinamidase-related amidase